MIQSREEIRDLLQRWDAAHRRMFQLLEEYGYVSLSMMSGDDLPEVTATPEAIREIEEAEREARAAWEAYWAAVNRR